MLVPVISILCFGVASEASIGAAAAIMAEAASTTGEKQERRRARIENENFILWDIQRYGRTESILIIYDKKNCQVVRVVVPAVWIKDKTNAKDFLKVAFE